MARKQTAIVRCDAPACKNYVEVPDLNVTPDKWYRVARSEGGKVASFTSKDANDFCSLTCVGKWANGRRKALVANGSESEANNKDRTSMGRTSAENREIVLKALQHTGEAMRSKEVSEASGMTQSTVDKHLASLILDGHVEVENIQDKSPTGWVRLY